METCNCPDCCGVYEEPEPEVVDECCVCGREIYDYEEHYDVNDDIVCEDCEMDYMRQFRKAGA